MPRSNELGRAFEYALCKEIITVFHNVKMTDRVQREQTKDVIHYNSLNDEMKKKYQKSSNDICILWLNKKLQSGQYTLDRLPDSAGVKGDVTDIRLESDAERINISLKHNHNALKHPRLTRVPCWLGMQSDKNYKDAYNKIWSEFFSCTKAKYKNVNTFEELVVINPDFINDHLYDPICRHVSDYLAKNADTEKKVQSMFRFLVGTYDFYKIIDKPDKITVQDFTDIPLPSSAEITQTSKSYVSIKFDNGVVLSMRLHTASKKLVKSVKFDVRGSFENLPEEIFDKNTND